MQEDPTPCKDFIPFLLGIGEPLKGIKLGNDIDFCILERSLWHIIKNKFRKSCYVLFHQ